MTNPRPYAQDTTVTVAKSRAEIEALLKKHGATSFVSGWDEEQGVAALQFRIAGRFIKFCVHEPDPKELQYTKARQRRNKEAVAKAIEKERKRRWRALLLIIKAKLEIVSTGYSTIEREFMADLVLPSGDTVMDWLKPQLDEAYESGDMPLALPGL